MLPAEAATVVNATIHIPADVRTNPCSPGDVLNLDGDIHIVITTTANGRAGYQVKDHLDAHLSGVSITTGAKYLSNEANNGSWSTGAVLPAVHRDVYSFLLISQGRTPNYVLSATVSETVDGTGGADVTAEQWSMSCQGRG
ncbi:hypothetical protein GCM10020358_59630 [Amorphoplanes nipponensis]|uniref:Uncharacterized protein n=1 Tax=Actinoplanes nipponensis TaxID=135950 RepID=A0A919MIZ8_9ACTN|nr:hypothetical protein Ani05nite_04750 [Actinoplanes nipponensis]